MAELVSSIREIGLLQPVVVRPLGDRRDGSLRARDGGAPLARVPRGRPGRIPAIVRDTGDDVTCCATRCWRTCTGPSSTRWRRRRPTAAAGGLRLHPRGARRADRPVPAPDQQHAPAAEAVTGGPATGGSRGALGRACPRPARHRRRGPAGPDGPAGRRRGDLRPRPRGDRGRRRPGRLRPPGVRRRPVAPGLAELADRLSDRFETRVKVDLGKSRGKVTVEFATLDDLRRIVEIIDP